MFKFNINKLIFLRAFKASQSMQTKWKDFYTRLIPSRAERWAYRVLSRRRKRKMAKINFRIFFSKRNRFFKTLGYLMTFNRFGESKLKFKKEKFFFRFLALIYGLRKLQALKTGVSFFKKKKIHGLAKNHALLTMLESQLHLILVRMLFVISGPWARFIINKKLVFVNGIVVTNFFFLVNRGALITINLLEFLNIRRLGRSNFNQKWKKPRSNYFKYCIWLFKQGSSVSALARRFLRPTVAGYTLSRFSFLFFWRSFLHQRFNQLLLLLAFTRFFKSKL